MKSSLIEEIRIEDVEFIKFINDIFMEKDDEKINQLLNSSLDLLNRVLEGKPIKNKKSLEWYFLDLLIETMANNYFDFQIFGLLVSYDLTQKNKDRLEQIRDALAKLVKSRELPEKERLLYAMESNIKLLYDHIDTKKIQKKDFDLIFGTNMMTV